MKFFNQLLKFFRQENLFVPFETFDPFSFNLCTEETICDNPSNNATFIDFEAYLMKKYKCSQNPHKNSSCSLRILAIADLHGHIDNFLDSIPDCNCYDICVLLGDNSLYDLKTLLNFIPVSKMIGVLGNHDEHDYYSRYGIRDINMDTISMKDISFIGIEGCLSYKDNMPGYTQEESLTLSTSLPSSDVLISHSPPFLSGDPDDIHNGLMGIAEYAYKNNISVILHGHLHESSVCMLKNGTIVKCVYGIELLDLNNLYDIQ